MKTHGKSGEITSILLVLLAGATIGYLLPSANPFKKKKDPQAERIVVLQEDLATATKSIENLRIEKESAVAQEREKMTKQVRVGQQAAWGAQIALKGDETPQAKAASRLLDTTNIALSAAIGNLPEDQKNEILLIVDLLVTQKTVEAEKALAWKEAEVKLLSTQREELATKTQQLEKDLIIKKDEIAKTSGELTNVTRDVIAKTNELKQAYEQKTSFSSRIESLQNILMYLAIAYILIHYILPVAAYNYPNGVVSKAYKFVNSIFSAH